MPADERAARFPLGRRVTMARLSADPYPILAELRAHEPVSWVPETGMWLVTRHDDVLRVLADFETYTVDTEDSIIRDMFGRHMMTLDGAEQVRHKKQCMTMFRPRDLLDTVGSSVDRRVDRLIDGFGASGRIELRATLARPLAVETVTEILGLPAEQVPDIARWYDRFAEALANFARDPGVRAAGHAAATEFGSLVRSSLASLRDPAPGSPSLASPGDPGSGSPSLGSPGDPAPGSPRTKPASVREAPRGSLLRRLAEAGDRLTDEEIVSNALIIMFGGIETTEAQLCSTVWSLLSHPAALAEVRADPSCVDAAIEESLRWQPAVQSCTRHVTTDTVLRGAEIAEGEVVQCMLGAANRDPDRFEDPDRFDLHRSNVRDHLAFGSGRHFCLGAPLARFEMRAAITALLARFPDLALDRERPAVLTGYEFRKPLELWLSVGGG